MLAANALPCGLTQRRRAGWRAPACPPHLRSSLAAAPRRGRAHRGRLTDGRVRAALSVLDASSLAPGAQDALAALFAATGATVVVKTCDRVAELGLLDRVRSLPASPRALLTRHGRR